MEFKPFTFDEVCSITGVPPATLDKWMKQYFTSCRGEDGTIGLDYMQCFAIFVGHRYVEQGSTTERAVGVMALVASLSLEGLMRNHRKGLTFAVPAYQINQPGRYNYTGPGVLVRLPNHALAQRLCTRKLLLEFKERLDRVFPTRGISYGGMPGE
jgi:hypothetical protein